MSDDARGVLLDMLCCPTCGARFDHALRRDERDSLIQTTRNPLVAIDTSPRYLLCERGHAWTIKWLIRREGEANEVLLDTYIGERP